MASGCGCAPALAGRFCRRVAAKAATNFRPKAFVGVLAKNNRLRTSADFAWAVRSGVRAGRPTVVIHVAAVPPEEPPQVGFVVSKAVGNAVQRNLVKRRLRAIAQTQIVDANTNNGAHAGTRVVVRALPAAVKCSYADLFRDVTGALETATTRRAGQAEHARKARAAA